MVTNFNNTVQVGAIPQSLSLYEFLQSPFYWLKIWFSSENFVTWFWQK